MRRIRQELLRATAIGSAVFGTVWQASAAQPLPYSWTGFYVGGFLGGATNNGLRFDTPDSSTFNTGFTGNVPRYFNTPDLSPGFVNASNAVASAFHPWPQTFGSSGSSLVGGLTFGYNVQQNGWLFGVEADFSLLGHGGRKSWADYTPFSGNSGGKSITGFRSSFLSAGGGLDSLATLRGRAGLVMDRWLVFGTGGLAVGRANVGSSASVTDRYLVSGIGSTQYDVTTNWYGSNSDIRIGYVLGGGAEYAVNDRFRLKFDSLFYNLGTLRAIAYGAGSYTTNGGSATTPSVQPYAVSKKLEGTLFRFGFNYGF